MLNALPGNTDEDRLRRLLQKLRGQKTDTVRLWDRVSQTPDGIGKGSTGLESPTGPAGISTAYTPSDAPTTTTAPTTSTTTTPAPATAYLYPIWDWSKGTWGYSSGSTIWSLIDDVGSWPDHTDYIRLADGDAADFKCWLTPGFAFSSLVSAELQIYVKNENANAPLVFTAQIIASDQVNPITDGDTISGVGTSEGSYSLRTCSLTLNADAQDWLNWIRPTLEISLENDVDAGTPYTYISAARVKLTYISEF